MQKMDQSHHFSLSLRKNKDMRKLSFDEEKFKELYKKGLTDQEIAKSLNCKDSAVFAYRKRNDLTSNFKYKCLNEEKLEEIKLLKSEGLGNRKISKLLNLPRTTLMYMFRKHDLKNIEPVKKFANLDFFQKSVLIGSLLGDSSISKSLSFNIGHSIKQRDYYNHKVSLFSPNITFLQYERQYFDKRTGNTGTLLQAYSHRFQDLNEMRKLFYPEDRKVINEEILKNFNEISLAYLYMDDGNISKENVVTIATCNFKLDELEIFRNFLFEKWKIQTSILHNKSIYIKANSRKTFFNIVDPYIIDSMSYKKLKSSLNSVNSGKAQEGNPEPSHVEIHERCND